MSSVPSWGTVTAAPHLHLIHIRDGRVLRAAQGGSCFKWPRDTVALVDTSVQRLQFTADQITREKVGVQVTGLAVFRVVRPLLAWRMLNLEDPGALKQILVEMFVGATRRLVANLSLEECLTRRKDAIASELMSEVAPVVSGHGREQDDSDQGWGVALDTIEVQDVRVLSQEVFERLQAGYREALALQALAARAEVEREEARLNVERAQAREVAQRELLALQEQRLAAERARARDDAAHRQRLESLSAEEALKRQHAAAEAAVERAALEASALRVAGEARAAVTRLEREAALAGAEVHLQELLLTETAPRVAEALRGLVEKVVIVGGAGEGLGPALAQATAALQAVGLRLPAR